MHRVAGVPGIAGFRDMVTTPKGVIRLIIEYNPCKLTSCGAPVVVLQAFRDVDFNSGSSGLHVVVRCAGGLGWGLHRSHHYLSQKKV
jgi:hypothetical protein